MNVNGATFHLFLGRDDWGRCTVQGDPRPLAERWTPDETAYDAGLPDYLGEAMTLPAAVDPIPLTPGERAYTLADRRDAAADRFGNRYRVADDREGLLVASVGDGRETPFWPAPRDTGWRPAPAFADRVAETAERLIRAVAVTGDDYLVAAGSLNGAEMLWRFDLVGGGEPDAVALPPMVRADALAPATEGGLWLLDGSTRRLLRHDRDMRLATQAQADGAASFAPVGEAPQGRARRVPLAIDCPAANAPAALASLPDGALLLLDAPAGAPSALHILDPSSVTLRPLIALDYQAFCLAVGEDEGGEPSVFLALTGGNEARRVALFDDQGQWQARAETDTIPLRRFGGRALVPSKAQIVYDSGPVPLWVPLVTLRHRRFRQEIVLVTPPLDGGEPQCLWDRVRLDACIPPGTAIRIEARSAEDAALLDPAGGGGWIVQPAPIPLTTGFDLPGKRPVGGSGDSWELLLQRITGRYTQFRVVLTGSGRNTPRLSALRAWFPRFSYARRFLPAIYREESGGGDFLDRFLANFEGVNSAIEDRIATAEMLFDPRTAPAEALDWLAGWFDTALDPAWDERQRRLFIAHAPGFFAWRGTGKGMLLALRLAMGQDVSEADFDLAAPRQDCPGGIRIVEGHVTRARAPLPQTSASDSFLSPGNLASGTVDSRWSPEEGSAGLWARWTAAGHAAPTGMPPFPLTPPNGQEAEWAAFSRTHFGFLPDAGGLARDDWQGFQRAQGIASTALLPLPTGEAGADLPDAWNLWCGIASPGRDQWQAFLTRRYRSVERLNAAHGTAWPGLDRVALPDRLPESAAAVRDWLMFEGQWLPMRRSAHRFSILLPRSRVDVDPDVEAGQLALAQRIVALEKPAHTLFDTRFYWAMNRIGEARLGQDTGIGEGSRAPELIPGALLGRSYIGAAFVGGPASPGGARSVLPC